MDDLKKIASFIEEHHVMSLASSSGDTLSVCSLFYAYDAQSISFIVASSDETRHIQNIQKNARVAGNILLETKTVGKIQGLQFEGEFCELQESGLKLHYFKNFPYAVALNPKLWQIKVDYFKMTDNKLGFGKKLIWQKPSL